MGKKLLEDTLARNSLHLFRGIGREQSRFSPLIVSKLLADQLRSIDEHLDVGRHSDVGSSGSIKN